MNGSTVATVMTRKVIILPKETMLDEAAQAMRDARIGGIVVTDGGTLTGMVTDRDIVVRAIAERLRPEATSLDQILTRELTMVPQTTTLPDAVQIMRERDIRRLLVCDADRQLVGIVSMSDLVPQPAVEAVADTRSP